MHDADLEGRAFRRRTLVGVGAFLLAFVTLLVLAAYLAVVHVRPERGWFDAITLVIQLLPFIFAGGFGVAWLAVYAVELPLYRQGRYRCGNCGRAFRKWNEICPCVPARYRVRRKPRRWVHYRRRIKPVLMVYLPILVVVLGLLATKSDRREPYLLDVAIGHAVLCALVGVLIHLTESVLEVLGRGRRWRLRATVFLRVFALWPFCFAVVMVIVKSFGWA